MKRLFQLIPIVLACLIISNASLAQQIPDQAKAAFNKKFSKAQNVNWGKEGTAEFEAEFTLNGIKMSANFDSRGNWKETETAIATSELPNAVQHTLSRDYSDLILKHAFKVESPNPTVYEVEGNKADHEKAEEDGEEEDNEAYEHENNVQELVFTKDGKLVHHKKEEEEDED